MTNRFIFSRSGLTAAIIATLGIPMMASEVPSPLNYPVSEQEAKGAQKTWADYLKQQVFVESPFGLKMALIPPGTFSMGSDGAENEAGRNEPDRYWKEEAAEKAMADARPARQVRISKPFRISTTEVTIAQFRKFIEATGYVPESIRDGRGGDARGWGQGLDYTWEKPYGPNEPVEDTWPVTHVTWNDAVAYCDWLSKESGKKFRLPTEAEWEYAARAGSQKFWFFGDDPAQMDAHAVALRKDRRHDRSATKTPNAFGLHDVAGNVWEWTADRGAPFERVDGELTDPSGAEQGERRVRKGGNFSVDLLQLSSAYRKWSPENYRGTHVGFRVVEEVEVER